MEDMAAPKSAGRKILSPNTFIEIFFFLFFLYFNSRVNVYLHFTRPGCPHEYSFIVWTFFDRMHRVFINICLSKLLKIQISNRSNKHRIPYASKDK